MFPMKHFRFGVMHHRISTSCGPEETLLKRKSSEKYTVAKCSVGTYRGSENAIGFNIKREAFLLFFNFLVLYLSNHC